MKNAVSFLVGLIFAIGLGIGGMTQTHIVRGFLDFTGEWNYTLIGVMAGAIAVHAVTYRLIRKRRSPLLDTQFHVPSKESLDRKLLLGAALFGLGWGWAGICPGPGIVSLASGNINIVIFVATMIVGMMLVKFIENSR